MSEPLTNDQIALKALVEAAERFSQLLRYVVEDNYMHDEQARHEAMQGLNCVVKAMGELERLF